MQKKDLYEDDYSRPGLNLTATISNRIATLTMLDSGGDVRGDNARA